MDKVSVSNAVSHLQTSSVTAGSELSWLSDGRNVAPETGVKVCVVGGGFVGLVTAACLAQAGHAVTCVEKDVKKVSELSAGRVPIFERGLPDLVTANLRRNRLTFETDLAQYVEGQSVVIITVGTPASADGHADLTALEAVVRSMAPRLKAGQTVAIKSTVPVGTARHVREMLNADGADAIAVVSNPEFLREGTAVYDFFHPQRVVVGGESDEAVERVVQLYRVGLSRPAPIVVTNNETAEMIKYASNVYLATRVSFINELSSVCDSMGIDVSDVSYAMGLDPRIGSDYFDVGPGFGGSCLPKDLNAFIASSEHGGVHLELAPAVRRANLRQLERVVAKIRASVGGDLKSKRIGVLGLSFKAQTQDMRDSPARSVIEQLLAEGAVVQAYDPAAMGEAAQLLPQIALCNRAEDVAVEADAIALLTEWPEFQLLDWAAMRQRVRNACLVDARNLLSADSLRRHGFAYVGLGRC